MDAKLLRLMAGFSLVAALGLPACKRTKSNPLLSTPASGVSAVSLSIPQIDVSGVTNERIFVYAESGSTPLRDFQLGNFSILEDGKPGVPSEVGVVTDPLSIALVIHRSGSMSGSRETAANAAATNFINALGANDFCSIVEFDNRVQQTVNFTTVKSELLSVIVVGRSSTTVFGGATAVRDATSLGADILNSRAGRKLLLVLTDGDDNSSTKNASDVIDAVNAGGLSAYMVGLGSGLSATAIDEMTRIAVETGGSASFSTTGSDLTSIFLSTLNRFNNMVYIKYRRRSEGLLTVFLNYGAITANATKQF